MAPYSNFFNFLCLGLYLLSTFNQFSLKVHTFSSLLSNFDKKEMFQLFGVVYFTIQLNFSDPKQEDLELNQRLDKDGSSSQSHSPSLNCNHRHKCSGPSAKKIKSCLYHDCQKMLWKPKMSEKVAEVWERTGYPGKFPKLFPTPDLQVISRTFKNFRPPKLLLQFSW